jgi:hypothetical protein
LHHLPRGRGLDIPVRVLIVVGGFLALPGTAAGHSGAPTVALDYRLRLSQATRALPAVRPTIVDGDRGLRLEVDPRSTLVVLGDLQEPMIRFDSRGVWVNRHSPTAEGAKLIRGSAGDGVSWSLASRGHGLRWHDHRLAPPTDLRSGGCRTVVDSGRAGRPAERARGHGRACPAPESVAMGGRRGGTGGGRGGCRLASAKCPGPAARRPGCPGSLRRLFSPSCVCAAGGARPLVRSQRAISSATPSGQPCSVTSECTATQSMPASTARIAS